MMIFLIILSVLLWAGAFAAMPRRILLSPALSYCAMLLISFATHDGLPIVPLSQGLTLSWLCMSLVVMLIIILQSPALRQQSRGVGYISMGGLAGMAVGLLAFTFSSSLQLLYAIMILATAAGIILGLLIFTNTPEGRPIAPSSGNFFKYLLAKGFPALVTIAQLGVVGVILIASFH